MAFSMTGIGRAGGEISRPPIKFEVEIRSYNHRFLDISVKLPNSLLPFEDDVKRTVQEKVSRGHVVVVVQQDREVLGSRFEIDQTLLDAYIAVAREMRKRYRTGGTVDINTLLAIPGLVKVSQNQVDTKSIFEEFKPIFARALAEFLKAKKREGDNTCREIGHSIGMIDREVEKIKILIPERNEHYRDRLNGLLKEIGEKVDKERLYQEFLYISDRTDVSEEYDRLCGHIALFKESLKNDAHPGRRLNFILQEMQREANTLSVKAGYLKISEAVVNIKEAVEKIREQVQNIE
jgi:uncharacterized protein (TIGR00255 family)